MLANDRVTASGLEGVEVELVADIAMKFVRNLFQTQRAVAVSGIASRRSIGGTNLTVSANVAKSQSAMSTNEAQVVG